MGRKGEPVKRIIALLLLCSCSATEPREIPEPAIFEPALPETEVPEAEFVDELKALDIEEIVQLGVDKYILEEQISELQTVVVFVKCLKVSTGEDLDGAEIERHIVQRTKHTLLCRKKLLSMSAKDIADESNAWAAKLNAAPITPDTD